MRTRWEKPKYDKRPSEKETLPELILRKWPKGEAEMDALLRGQDITYGDYADLCAEIKRKNDRCVELVQRHGVPAHIMRTREEFCLLIEARELIDTHDIA